MWKWKESNTHKIILRKKNIEDFGVSVIVTHFKVKVIKMACFYKAKQGAKKQS
jgi:hypothetical protein